MCSIIFLYRPASTPHIYSFIYHTTLLNRCIYQSAAVSAVRHAYEYHRRRSGRFFMVHHHTSSTTSTPPTTQRMRTTHIVDKYDIYTTLGPPTNSLRRSPTEYRCNKVSRKTLSVLLQWHYLFTVCPPLTTTAHPSTKWRCLRYYYNRLGCG